LLRYWAILSKYDGFIVTHTPVFARLFERFEKPVILVNSCRYDQPFMYNGNTSFKSPTCFFSLFVIAHPERENGSRWWEGARGAARVLETSAWQGPPHRYFEQQGGPGVLEVGRWNWQHPLAVAMLVYQSKSEFSTRKVVSRVDSESKNVAYTGQQENSPSGSWIGAGMSFTNITL
jgi:hypothetical protein